MSGRPRKPDSNSLPRDYKVPEDRRPDASLYDVDNPQGLNALLEPFIGAILQGVPSKYLQMTEQQLKKAVEPDATLSRLRLRFWEEYALCAPDQKKIQITRVIKGACSRDYFYDVVLRDPKLFAWVITPPVDHLVSLKEMLDEGLAEIRHELLKPTTLVEKKFGRDGVLLYEIEKTDNAMVSNKIKLLQMLLDRVHGAVINKNQNLNVHVGKEADPLKLESSSIEDLERIEAKLTRLLDQSEAPRALEPAVVIESPTVADYLFEGEDPA